MLSLAPDLRSILEKAVLRARDVAENAARAFLEPLDIANDAPKIKLTPDANRLRIALRAQAKQLGGGSRTRGVLLLVEQIAYQEWHRMLFARFLAENNLLMHPELGVPVTLQECAELAPEYGAADGWQLAARFASEMLPGIFRESVLSLRGTKQSPSPTPFARESQLALEKIVENIPSAIFRSDDGLGWVYQFWQTKKKKEVNASERKIGGADIAPVTQLFTEDYMVRFLLENTLGAWWAARHPDSPLVQEWKYLRFLDDGAPAAGTFDGWQKRAAEITFMDPCCGSGHFCVYAFELLRKMRMAEEGLDERAAGDAVLRDNLYALELDPRCTQIAAFALALAAWKSGGYRKIPVPHIACSGIAVQGQLEEWTKLARGDAFLKTALERLYELFKHAPDLGSLINPADVPENEKMFTADYARVEPLLEKALARERQDDDPVGDVFGAAAEETMSAAKLLAEKYTIVATNVPYLARGRQSETLKEFCERQYPEGKADLATAFLERCRDFSIDAGAYALVTPQNWLFLGAYKNLRYSLINTQTLDFLAKLGEGGFESTQAAGAFTALPIITNALPQDNSTIRGIDASHGNSPFEKAKVLRELQIQSVHQKTQIKNPDCILMLSESGVGKLLRDYARTLQGIGTADANRYIIKFWEIASMIRDWSYYQMAPEITAEISGYHSLLRWENGNGDLAVSPQARICGQPAWGKKGVAVAVTRNLYRSNYLGEKFDCTLASIIPENQIHLDAIRAFVLSDDFVSEVRKIDQALSVTESSFGKVPFDLAHWQRVADEMGPLPEPFSNDPTQWLFEGQPVGSTEPLQVAVARLLGYKWHRQKPDALDKHADADGIVCLPALAHEPPAAERLRALLVEAYEIAAKGEIALGDKEHRLAMTGWTLAEQERLLSAVGFAGKTLDAWLRDGFFAQHAKLFHNRPFIWHIWDGRRDGFAALVNYHRLDAAKLERLIYTYLGDWREKQKREMEQGVAGAEARYLAAQELHNKLVAIHQGEPPYDIFVRWKTRAQQPIGWNPDLNDGVRLNIRPFVTADVLRAKFTIHWNKDRGKNPDGSERLNDLHLTRAEKDQARFKN